MSTLREDFLSYYLYVHCFTPRCGNSAELDAAAIARRCGWDIEMEELRARMRCRRCGRKECRIYIGGRWDGDGRIKARCQAVIGANPGPEKP